MTFDMTDTTATPKLPRGGSGTSQPRPAAWTAEELAVRGIIPDLVELTREGPVSGWIDRIGEAVRDFGSVPLSEIDWKGSPENVAYRVSNEAIRRNQGPRLAAYLQAKLRGQ